MAIKTFKMTEVLHVAKDETEKSVVVAREQYRVLY